MALFDQLEHLFQIAVLYGILFLEWAGVTILLVTGVKSLYIWLQRQERVRLVLAQGIALALEFKLGGEVLRTVIVREGMELAILGAIILLRGALTLLIHWEINTIEKAGERR